MASQGDHSVELFSGVTATGFELHFQDRSEENKIISIQNAYSNVTELIFLRVLIQGTLKTSWL